MLKHTPRLEWLDIALPKQTFSSATEVTVHVESASEAVKARNAGTDSAWVQNQLHKEKDIMICDSCDVDD